MRVFEPAGEARPVPGLRAAAAALVVLHLVLGQQAVGMDGVAPDFLLVLTALVALAQGPSRGCAAGFALGLLSDLTGSGPVGLSALLMSVCGYALGGARFDDLQQGWPSALLPLAGASAAYRAAGFVGCVALGAVSGAGWSVVPRIALSCCLDVAVAALCLAALARASRGAASSGGLRMP